MESRLVKGSSIQEIEANIKSITSNDFSPTLAIVFGSHECKLQDLPKLFTNLGIQLIGASSAGEFTGEEIAEKSIMVMLMDLDPSAFKIFEIESDYARSFVAGKKIGEFAKSHFADPSFILMFSLQMSGESLISGINDEVSGRPSIFGGMAGDDLRMKETYTFSHNRFGSDIISVLVLDNNKVEAKGMALCGWQPIGVEHQITKAKDNIVYSINNQPALEVVKQYFGDYYDNSLEEDTVLMGAAQYPLQLKRGGSNILRAALTANETDGSLFLAGPVSEGDYFKFSVAPGFEVIDETIKGFADYYEQNSDADAMILFSCKARHMSLGPLVEEEITGIHNIWKKPLIGFFCYGEVGQGTSGTSYFYNETCSLVLLKEKTNSNIS